MEDDVPELVTVVAVFADARRAALTAPILDADDELDLLGRAGDTDELLALAGEHVPDVVLLELGNPAVDVHRAVAELHAELPVVRVVVAADHLGADSYDLLLAGAAGGLDRSEHPASLSSVLVGAARREVLLPSAWAARAIDDVERARTGDPFADVLRLTETEGEVLERLAAGDRIAALADDYGVTERLVALHVGYVVTKLQRHAHVAGASASVGPAAASDDPPVGEAF